MLTSCGAFQVQAVLHTLCYIHTPAAVCSCMLRGCSVQLYAQSPLNALQYQYQDLLRTHFLVVVVHDNPNNTCTRKTQHA